MRKSGTLLGSPTALAEVVDQGLGALGQREHPLGEEAEVAAR